VPEAPPVTVIHGAAVVAARYPAADTATAEPLPAVAGNDWDTD
jgi:hypothetical protein